jgi:hypothetical protein
MTGRIGCIVAAALVLLASAAAAQQAPKSADPRALPPAAAPAAKGQKQASPASPIAVPPPEALLALIRSALIALDHANWTDNYTVLRELGGPGLQRYSSAQLGTIFAGLRQQNVDLLPVAVVTPQLTQAPTISREGLLQLIGFFPTQPRRIEFHIVYQPVAQQWKLFGLTVNLAAAPQASTPQAGARTAAPVGAPPAPSKK